LMKRKMQKILGIGLTLALVLSLGLVFAAAPVAAEEDEFSAYPFPEDAADGDWFMSDDITAILALDRDIDDYLWASVTMGGEVLVPTIADSCTLTATAAADAGILIVTHGEFNPSISVDGDTDSLVDGERLATAPNLSVGVHTFVLTDNTDAVDLAAVVADSSFIWYPTNGAPGAAVGTYDGGGHVIDADGVDSAEIMKSLDTEGRGWEATEYSTDVDVPAIDIVCSPLDADVVYTANAATVEKTEDGGDAWTEVGDFDTDIGDLITCLAVGWDDDDDARCFVGIADDDPVTDADASVGGVFYLYDVPFGTDWADLELGVDVGDLAGDDVTVFGFSVSPNFSDDSYQAALVLNIEDGQTYMASHEGSDPGGWTVVEINDDAGVDLVSTGGSDPVFPSDFTGDDFEAEDTEIFVGIAGDLHAVSGLGGVVRVYGVDAGDYEILDDVDDDIISLDMVGSLNSTQMLAGAEDADVWYSWDDGGDWEQASAEGINPSGLGSTVVLMDADFDEDAGTGWAATSGGFDTDEEAECGFHGTIDGGTSWQGYSLLSDEFDWLYSAAIVSSSPDIMYWLTEDFTFDDEDVYRYDSADETWERVWEHHQYGEVSDFDVLAAYGDVVVIGEVGDDDMFFSTDQGQTWAQPDEVPGDDLESLLLIDEDTWWVGDDGGAGDTDLWVTDDQGDRAWDEYDIVADAGGCTSLEVRGDEAIAGVAGVANAEAYYSEDAGETWDIVGGAIDADNNANTFVCFADDNTDVIYAAADDTIARFQYLTTDLEEDWENYTPLELNNDADLDADFDNGALTGIGCMDGVLYVSTNANVDVTDAGAADDVDGGVARCVNPLEDLDDVDESDWDHVAAGLTEGDDPLNGGMFLTAESPNVIWGIELDPTVPWDTLWTYEDLMVGPATGLMADPGDTDFAISLDGFDNATDYEFSIYSDEDMRVVYRVFDANTADDEPLLILADADVIDIDNADLDDDPTTATEVVGIDAGTQYWVMARAYAPVHSKWSAVFTFNTDPGGVGVDEDTLAPQLGAIGVPVTTPFSWGFDEDADSYLIEISDTADFSNIIDSATVTVPTYESSITLNEGTSYWFRVYAISGGQMGNPAYSNFTTEIAGGMAPTPPAAAPSTPVNVVQQTVTPNFILAIIGIGIGLAVAVGILIRKTRS